MNRVHPFHRTAHPRRGMSLVELAIVTVIIGILASMGIPSFHRALEQSRADLAAANLWSVWSAQRLYWLDNRTYAPDLATLESAGLLDHSVSAQNFYSVGVAAADDSTFTATATRASNARWNGTLSIDQNGAVFGVLSADGLPDIVPSYH
jgi:prepilin-type N-terminal cleavage/methylation domain-containing protein